MNKLIYIALAGVALSQLHGCAAVAVGGAATGTAVALTAAPLACSSATRKSNCVR